MIDELAPRDMYKMLKEARADIMLSGGRSQFVALKAKMPWLDINQERVHAYAGYEGIVELVKEIDRTIYNPVWAQVRMAAPWESDGAGVISEVDATVIDVLPAAELARHATGT
jgi:nitrogenase molybdenum-cofactor synthesis protein NifE